MYRLPVSLRPLLAAPLAPVLDTRGALVLAAGRVVVAVGDVVTQMFLDHGVVPRVMVVDGVTQRSVAQVGALANLPSSGVRLMEVANEAATISRGLWSALELAFGGDAPTLIQVIGEEDLAALPALLLAPEGALVCYGQPNEGVVCVPVDDAARERARGLIDQMEVE